MPIERHPDGTDAIPYPHKIVHWKTGAPTLWVEMTPGGWFNAPPEPTIPGWKCFFHSHFGVERVVYSYKPETVA